MRIRKRCRACGGIYFTEGLDGAAYYHVCPPLSIQEDGTTVERQNKRDERPDPREAAGSGLILAPGDGAADEPVVRP